MSRALFVPTAMLLGLGSCVSSLVGIGGDEGSHSGTSGGTDPHSTETLSASGASTMADTTGAESLSSSGGTTTGQDGESSTSETTGGPPGVTPCQPKIIHGEVEGWRSDVDNRVPTTGPLVLPLVTVAPNVGAAGSFADRPSPHSGGRPGGGGALVECDVWAQDCEEGEKCAAWGAGGWSATHCVQVPPDVVGVGETCTVEEGQFSGMDNCEWGSMCWEVDDVNEEGTCIALCGGTPEAPTCAGEGTACSLSNLGVLNLCLPICNPLADECEDGQGCYPSGGESFYCAPEAGDGEVGDSCGYINACLSGAACASTNVVSTCSTDSEGCCSSYCDLTADDPGCLEGQECLPWYEMGEEPDVCLEGIGICGIPT